MRKVLFVPLISALLFIVACGGGSSNNNSGGPSTPGSNTIVPQGANNVAPLIVDAGPPTVASSSDPDYNIAFTTIVVCAPGTSNCVTIDHVQVDTGSTGLRLPAEAFANFSNGSAVLAALQNVNPAAPVAECVEFGADTSFTWGAVRFADVKMGGSSNTGEVASSVPIQVTGDSSVPTIPSDCIGANADTVETLGANGLLGVGTYQYDCDAVGFLNACASATTPPPGAYYTCPSSVCTSSLVPLSQQVRNPVSLFATDNNGVILEMPTVPLSGQAGISLGQAALVFGIGTQSNNGLGGAVVLPLDPNPTDPSWAGITTVFNGVSYPNSNTTTPSGSFLDSGTAYFFFLDQPLSGIPAPTSCNGWYCPSSTLNLTAINQATGGNSTDIAFNVANPDTLSTSNTAFVDLAAPLTPGTPDATQQADDGFFDWGLPFFYGRNVFTAIWNVPPPNGVPAGPYWAY